MSVQSQAEFNAVSNSAAQAIAGKSALDKPDDSVIEPPPAAEAQSAEIHHEEDTRVHTMADYRACDEYLPAAIIMGQLRYYQQAINPKTGRPRATIRRDGRLWSKMSLPDWKNECGLDKTLVKTAVGIMVRNGLVIVEHLPWGHFKSKAAQYSLTDKALAMGGPHVEKSTCYPKHQSKSSGATESTCGNPPITETSINLSEKEKTKPVDEKITSTDCLESFLESGKDKKTKPESEPKTTPDAVKKPRKISKLGTVFDETKAKNYPTNLKAPKGQKNYAYANLSHVKDRMQAAGYSYEAVTRFVEYMAGDGWGIVRAQWKPEFNPQINALEKAPECPDLGWLVGNENHGTGMHRLEVALDVWHMDGEPWPGAMQPAEPQEAPATPLVEVPHAVACTTAAPTVSPEPEPVDPRLSVADAWELIERASSLTPMIESWRGSVAAGVPVPDLEKYLRVGIYQGPTAEYLEIALALMPPAEPASTPAPVEPEPVHVPAIAQASSVTPTPCSGGCDDETRPAATPEQNRKWWAEAMARKTAEDAQKKATTAKLTASGNPYAKPTPKPKMLFAKVAAA